MSYMKYCEIHAHLEIRMQWYNNNVLHFVYYKTELTVCTVSFCIVYNYLLIKALPQVQYGKISMRAQLRD